MIIQENDFLRTYNEMNKLWEDTGDDVEIETALTFNGIANQAVRDLESGVINIQYWRTVRTCLDSKPDRRGEKHKNWCSKFMSYYKSYIAECAIKEWLEANGADHGITAVDFGDLNPLDHHLLVAGPVEATPDLKATINGETYTIECKTLGAPSTVHKAQLVARHAEVDTAKGNQQIQFCVVGYSDIAANITNAEELLFVLNPSMPLETTFNKFPVPGIVLDINPVAKLDKLLSKIDRYLNQDKESTKDKLATLLNAHAVDIDSTTQKIIDKHYPKRSKKKLPIREPKKYPSKTLQAATRKLLAVADDLTAFEQTTEDSTI